MGKLEKTPPMERNVLVGSVAETDDNRAILLQDRSKRNIPIHGKYILFIAHHIEAQTDDKAIEEANSILEEYEEKQEPDAGEKAGGEKETGWFY